MKRSKNKKAIEERFDRHKEYSLEEAIQLVKQLKFARFDESVDLAVNLGVDPRHADQNIRVTTSLPHGTGNPVRVLVLAKGPKEKEAQEAGADFVGHQEYLDKIKAGWSEVDKIVALPSLMPEVGKLGKILGPKGLMPNPKSGTVTSEIGQAVRELKAGKVELRVEKNGIVHTPCGKTSFSDGDLIDNVRRIMSTIQRTRPAAVKGQFIKKITLSSSMGPGIKIDPAALT